MDTKQTGMKFITANKECFTVPVQLRTDCYDGYAEGCKRLLLVHSFGLEANTVMKIINS